MPPVHSTSVPSARISEPGHASYRVDVANETDTVIDAARLAAAVQTALADARCEAATVSVAIVDDATIHRLNRQFLEHDYPTDVLSFPLAEPPHLKGEIVTSVDTARREADSAGWRAEDELLLYVVHGALHLVGHDDYEPSEAAAMRAAERAVLARLGVAIPATDPRWQPDDGASPGGREGAS
jgi:probable rRNA maturation factor